MRRGALAKITAAVLLSCVVFVVSVYCFRFAACFYAASYLAGMKYTAVRFSILGASENSISARFHLYDVTGTELAVIERSWKDDSLIFDFAYASFNGVAVYVPHMIRGSDTAAGMTGTLLGGYYTGRRIKSLPLKKQSAVNCFIRYAQKISPFFPSRFGSVRSVDLRQCRPGIEYGIVCDTDGLLVLVRE